MFLCLAVGPCTAEYDRNNSAAPDVILSPPHADTSNRPRLAVSLAGTIRVDDIPTGLVLDDLGAERGPP